MLDERSQNLMLAAIDDDIDVAQLEEELAELHGAAPDGGEGPRTATKTSAPARGPAALSFPILGLVFLPPL